MVAKADVLGAAGEQLAGAWNAVHKTDQERFGCRYVRRYNNRVQRGEFDEDEAREDGEKLGKKAVGARDWAAFFQKLIDFWKQIAPLFIK